MPEPAGIDVTVAEDVTSITVTSEDAINVAITEDTTTVAVSSVPATTTGDSISITSHGTVTAESNGSFLWQSLVAGGFISGEASSMDKLDGGLF